MEPPDSIVDPLGQDPIEIDLSCLTTRQLVAFYRALEMGYYTRNRDTDLSEVADEFDISKSALSQRLARAEEKLMRQVLDGLDEVDH